MIKHVVCWKLYEEALGKGKQRNAEMIRERLQALSEAIPTMHSVEIGVNSSRASQDNYDVTLLCEFDDFETLKAYQEHPEHQAFVEFVTPLTEHVVNVDFEKA